MLILYWILAAIFISFVNYLYWRANPEDKNG